MALFGRRKSRDLTDEDLLQLDEDDDAVVRPDPAQGEPGVDRDWERAGDGPYDVTEWSGLEGRIDLGALRLPAVRGMQMRLDVEQGTGRVIGVTLGFGASHAQVQVFAAPRSSGLWDELRAEIAGGLVDSGGAAEVADGLFGRELRARMPGRAPDGRVAFQPARFLGVDGPRWFLRVVVNGPAATDDAQLRGILTFVRRIVVRRGDEPRPPREVLELTPPPGFAEAAQQQAQQQAQARRAAQGGGRSQVTRPVGLGVADATGVSGVSVGGAADSSPTSGHAPTDAPKKPVNPDFT